MSPQPTPQDNPLGFSHDFLANIVAVLGMAEQLPDKFPSAEVCNQATQLREKLNQAKLDVESRRVNAKKPFLAEARRIDNLAEVIFDMVKPMIQALDARRQAYRNAAAAPVVSTSPTIPAPGLVMGGGTVLGIPDLSEQAGLAGLEEVKLKSRTHKVLDVVDENVVPREYWVLDTAKITADLKAGKHVPGCLLRDKEILL
jgi:hypothetical protein